MPLYEVECTNCAAVHDHFSSVAERRNTPSCHFCQQPTKLIISAVAGVVRFPAAGGHEYRSPVSGKPITTERARRDDLARNNCRPYEGFEAEKKEAQRRVKDDEAKSDKKLEENVRKAFHQLAPEKRRHLGA